MNCKMCDKELKQDDQVCELKSGRITKDEIGGIGFEETPSCSPLGCVHINCLFDA